MDNLQSVQLAITKLKGPVTTNSLKLKNYAIIRDCLDGLIKKCSIVWDQEMLQEVFDLANLETTTQDSNLQQVVFAVLSLTLKCNLEINFLKEIPTAYIQLAFNDSSNCNESVKNAAYNCLSSCLKLIITNNTCDVQSLFLKLSDKFIKDKVCNLLSNVYADVSAEKSVVFFYERSVCAMFESSEIDVRDGLIKLNSRSLTKFQIALLKNDKFEKYKAKVRKSYVPRIVELRCSRDSNWSNLFKFILKCFGKLLHIHVDVINDLLKAIESAFRSSNLDDRFQAFECWKELIDNYSLDMNRLCGSKQMKLLITPLKTNISTNDHIIYKRFEIWVHLFNILQDKAIASLEQFLQFCFGNGTNDSPSLEGGQNTQLYEGSTQALLEVMGHYHHNDLNTCFEFSKSFLKLHEPLVNNGNFESVANSIVHAVAKCTSIILQWMTLEHVPKVVYCLWSSLFVKVKEVDVERQEQVIKQIIPKLQMLIQASNSNENYQYVIVPILELLVKENFFEKEIFARTFFPLIKYLFDYNISICLNGNNVVCEFIKYSKNYENIKEWLGLAYDIIVNGKRNFQSILILWIECAGLIPLMNEFDGLRFQNKIVDFMVWPLLRKDAISSEMNHEFIKRWKLTFKHVSKLFPKETSAVIERLQIVSTQENVFVICLFCKVFCQIFESSGISDFEIVLIHLTRHLLSSFSLRKSDASLLLPVVTMLLNKATLSSDTSYLTSLCNCFTVLLQQHKRFKLLDALEENVEKIVVAIPESLVTVLSDIKTLTNDEKIILKSKNILQKINSPDDKCAAVKTKLNADAKQKILSVGTEPSSLLLFGQNVLSPNHTDIRGSRLNDKTNLKPKEVSIKVNFHNRLIVDDDDETKYVPVDTNYMFDPKKLSEHQLEVIKSRKSDIPALYQDLTQSQSNFGSSNSNSKFNDLNTNTEQNFGNGNVKDPKHNVPKKSSSVTTPNPNEERVNLCVPNPSQEQIEAMIRSGDLSNDVEDLKKRERVEKELMKLKLDLVGGEFVQNIDLMGKRETRRKSDQNFKQFKFLRKFGSPQPRRTRNSEEIKQKSGRDGLRKNVNSPSKLRNERKVGDFDGVKKSLADVGENLKEVQSEDVIESSQKPREANRIDSNVIRVLNSEFEEIVSRISLLETEPVQSVRIEKENVDLIGDNRETCDMETETLDVCDEIVTPTKPIGIPTSPVRIDTPTRTSELIKDTCNISPIKLQEDIQKTEELFESESIREIPLSKEDDEEVQIVEEIVPENDIQLKFFNKRLKKLPNNKLLTPINKRLTKIIKSPVVFSAQTHRIMKMMQKCEKKLEFHEQVTEALSNEKVNDEYDVDQEFFKFARELPSPKASPRCSILKRKACEFMDDGLSPPRKKRVNFPDPPTTSKVMYVPDVNEHSKVGIDPFDIFGNVEIDNGEEILPTEETEPVNTGTQGTAELVDVQLMNSSDPVFVDLINCKDDIGDVVTFLSDSMFSRSLLDELHAKNIKTVGDLARLTEVEINRLPIKSPKITNLRDVLTKHNLQNNVHNTPNVEIRVEKNEVVQKNHEFCVPAKTCENKQKRRVPLKAVTEGDDANGNNFKPLILEPILCNSKGEDALNKLLEELDNVKLLTKKEGVKQTALCKLLIDIIEPKELLQILQDKSSFSLSSLIKEKDWPKILKEVITSISLRKFVTLLCSIPSISPINILHLLIDETLQSYQDNNSPELQRTISRIIEISSPSVALKHISLQEIIKEMHLKCIDSKLSTGDFFRNAFTVFSPSIEDIIPSFQNINIVHVQDKFAERHEEDLLTFVERVLPIMDTSKVCSIITKEKMLPLFTTEELIDRVIETVTSPCGIVESCEKLVRQLPRVKADDNTYEPIIFSLFDKIPTPDLCRYFSKYLSKFADSLQIKEQL